MTKSANWKENSMHFARNLKNGKKMENLTSIKITR